eukprot:scaffold177526_cov32-Tisochrysis_lutea.AAC.1
MGGTRLGCAPALPIATLSQGPLEDALENVPKSLATTAMVVGWTSRINIRGPPISGGLSRRIYPAAIEPASDAMAADCWDDLCLCTARRACSAAALAASAAPRAALCTAPRRAWLEASEVPTGAKKARADGEHPKPAGAPAPACQHAWRWGGWFETIPMAGSSPAPREIAAAEPTAPDERGPVKV